MTDEKPKKEELNLSKDELQGLVSEAVKEATQSFVSEMDKLKKDRDILMQSADKKALAKYYQRNRGDMPPTVKLRTIGGKLIVSWKMLDDKGSYQVPGTGRWTEYQEIEVEYEDETKEKMAEMDFERRYEKVVEAVRISSTIDDVSGEEIWELQRKDTGAKVKLPVKFVN